MYTIFIDSGINKEFKDFRKKKVIDVADSGLIDFTGHGTSCSSCYINFSNNQEIGSIKIFNKNNTTDVDMLYQALEKCVYEKNIRSICLSLKLDNIDLCTEKKFRKIVEKLQKNKVIIVSPMPNDKNKNNFFLNLNGIYKTRFEYNNKIRINDSKEKFIIFEDSYRLYPTLNGEYKFFWGNSISSPAVVAYLENNKILNYNYRSNISDFSKIKLKKIYDNYNLNNKIGIYRNAFSFLKNIEYELRMDLIYSDFIIEDFINYKAISNRLEYIRSQNEFT